MNDSGISNEFKKVLALLLQHYEKNHLVLGEFFRSSTFQLRKHPNTSLAPEWKAFNILARTQHEIYLKNYDQIASIQRIIRNDINKVSSLTIGEVEILPDYDKFEIVESRISPILTEWDEINIGQSRLLEQLQSSSDSLDLQHIGNISRTIMLKLSELVYVNDKHRPDDKNIQVTPDKFKNRLTSFIIKELSGDKNAELRKFSKAAIETVEKLIDLANQVTHKADVDRTFAEVCVIGTIGAISIIKLIYKQNSQTTN